MLSTLFRHEQTVYAQASQSAACMAAHHVEARLSRWLLRSRDLAGTDSLQFTQEFLSEMLGVKRTSVTLHARTLQQAGLIKYSRGHIRITDVEGPAGSGLRMLRDCQIVLPSAPRAANGVITSLLCRSAVGSFASV